MSGAVNTPVRAALILGRDDSVPNWVRLALEEALGGGLEIAVVLNCGNEPTRPRHVRNAGYFALAAAAKFRSRLFAPESLAPLLGQVSRVSFDSQIEGIWQRIPAAVAAQVGAAKADVALRFGIGLLRDPEDLPVHHGVLSYHHGDPSKYRGRPAGFYEMLNGEATQGVIVQRLGNTLDGGEVLARAQAQVVASSYRKTLENVYSAGIPLLGEAIAAIQNGRAEEPQALGKNYTLPDNRTAARMASGMVAAKFGRLTGTRGPG